MTGWARTPVFGRVLLIVLDGVGVGALPDARRYGDAGSDTVGHIASAVPLAIPFLRSLGLDRVVSLGGGVTDPAGAFGRMAEASAGKDSVTGHWEMMGVVLDLPFPTFPDGFPAPLMTAFERRIGRGTLGNVIASGTAIIERLGPEHMRTGRPIVYTSADSVFQVAAHEDVIPVPELYRICEIAFELAARGAGVGRVIARPFTGTPGAFTRTANRHDYARDPVSDTLLDELSRRRVPVAAIGKIGDLFAGRGITRSAPTTGDEDGFDTLAMTMANTPSGMIFMNLVDCDTLYGHRNDVAGYAASLERIDGQLGRVSSSLREQDLMVVTADHGNDPTTPSTDHSREYVPLLVSGPRVRAGIDLGTRATFADVGQTLADNFGVGPLAHGTSFLENIVAEYS
ncbi:MAG: phosphopentomutase [Acidobacteria bacterium]|nr:phosphopentomutase [Acidobacteriota bacterium]